MKEVNPTRQQYKITREVVQWYFKTYHRTQFDIGVTEMFCDPSIVGHFSVRKIDLRGGDGESLFRMLVAMTMFQRRQDAQILRVLRSLTEQQVIDLTDASRLLQLVDLSPCEHIKTTATLKNSCDLGKDPDTKKGFCLQRMGHDCHLKEHTVLLKRYGHFGKVPTSAALMVREFGANDLAGLKEGVFRDHQCPQDRSTALEGALSKAWRISDKIAAMFLSAVTNRDLSGNLAPWSEGVASSHFIVIDSNVDLFLKAICYDGPMSYNARRKFIQALARRVNLDVFHSEVQRYNPRIVQQALYMFMSASNRRASSRDCSNAEPRACKTCPPTLLAICPRHKE